MPLAPDTLAGLHPRKEGRKEVGGGNEGKERETEGRREEREMNTHLSSHAYAQLCEVLVESPLLENVHQDQ